jgi:hypothetical protein
MECLLIIFFIYISPVTDDIKHLFMCLLASCLYLFIGSIWIQKPTLFSYRYLVISIPFFMVLVFELRHSTNIFLVALEFELRTSCLLGLSHSTSPHCTTWVTSPTLFTFSYFSNRVSLFFLGWSTIWSSLPFLPLLQLQTCATVPSILLVEMRFLKLFAWGDLEPSSS